MKLIVLSFLLLLVSCRDSHDYSVKDISQEIGIDIEGDEQNDPCLKEQVKLWVKDFNKLPSKDQGLLKTALQKNDVIRFLDSEIIGEEKNLLKLVTKASSTEDVKKRN